MNELLFKRSMQLLFVLLFCCGVTLSAQQKKVRGTVSGDGGPLPGVSIIVKGQNLGAVTDFDGNYELSVSESDVLVFSYIGFKSIELSVKGKSKLNVELKSNTSALDEVVVIGYGSVKRKDLTGAIASIKSEAIDRVKSTSFEGALASKVAGVQVVTTEGGPDAALKIRIRGGTSINASSDPLYVIDGFAMSGQSIGSGDGTGNSSTSPLASLDPSSIESIDVLKDASATAIYGSRGANGVVIITTKKGKKGRMNLTFDTFTSISTLSNKLDVLTAQEFIDYSNDFQPYNALLTDQKLYLSRRYRIDDGNGNFVPIDVSNPVDANGNPLNLIIDDWQERITRPAFSRNYRLSANGGTDKTNYNASLSYLNREGIIKTSDLERYTVNLSVNQKITNRLRTGLNLNVGNTSRGGVVTASDNNNQGRAGVVTSAALFSPIQPIRHAGDEDFSNSAGIVYDENGRMIANQNGDIANPISMLEENKNEGTIMQARFNAFAELKLAEGLTFKSSIRGFSQDVKNKLYYSERIGWTRTIGGKAVTNFTTNKSIVTEQNLSYKKRFGQHSINAVLVAENQKSKWEYLNASSTGFEIPNYNVDALQSALVTLPTSSNANETTLQSYLARIQYDGFNKYLVTASIRYDGSSKFAAKNRWSSFKALGLGWRVSNEDFLKNNDYISNLKLRASYGETGNNQIPPYGSLSQANLASYVFDGSTLATGAAIGQLENEELTWETTKQVDVGLSLGLLDNRINIEADYYNKETEDLLLRVPIPVTSGFTTAFKNIGAVRNTGYEFSLDAKVIDKGAFKWNTNFNISFNKNKVLNLGGADEFFVTAIGGGTTRNDYVIRVGESLGSVYGLQDDGVYTYNDFVEFDGMTNEEASATLYGNVTGNENWYSVNIYNLKEGVVKNSLVTDGTYRPGMAKFVDKNNDGVINDDDRQIIGNTQPKHFGGLTNNFSYKGFDLSVQTSWSYGNDIYNKNLKKGTNTANPWGNKYALVNERWSPENPENTLTSFNTGASGNFNSAAYSRFIEDGSFLRLSNVTLGYKLSNKLAKSIGLSGLRLYAAADNLYVWTKYSGWDPDVSVGTNQLTPGLDVDSYPRARTFRIGLNARF